MTVDFKQLRCEDCPAISIRDNHIDHAKHCEKLRDIEIDKISSPKLFLLCESIPNKGFIYDRSIIKKRGLRVNLRNELIGDGTDDELFEYLIKHGVVILDCALCPLHLLKIKKDRRRAATICLNNNTHKHLSMNPNIPIITIFPSSCGFLRRGSTDVKERVKFKTQSFDNLSGLKKAINEFVNSV